MRRRKKSKLEKEIAAVEMITKALRSVEFGPGRTRVVKAAMVLVGLVAPDVTI